MLTPSGPMCDVCGKYILLDPSMETFAVQGITQALTCHTKCRPAVEDALKGTSWKLLPDGPLRKVFEENEYND